MADAAAVDQDLTASLRSGRDALVVDPALRGTAFGERLCDLVDAALATILERSGETDVAVVAMGSYARRELCPGSDIDVVLLVPQPRFSRRRDWRSLAERLWYPLWDAGFVTGHGTRTVKETLALADEDLDARTASLDVRLIAGNRAIYEELALRASESARAAADPVLRELATGADLRRQKPGPVAEMLEPNLKDGAGGLRDIHALGWANRLLGGTAETDELVKREAITLDDAETLEQANAFLLQTRVELHRVTSSKSDVLALQDQDAVAERMMIRDADALMHDLARIGRSVAWIAREAWSTLVPDAPVVIADLPEGLALFDGRLGIIDVESTAMTTELVLLTAVAAATHHLTIGRRTLHQMASMPTPQRWTATERRLFIALLRQGHGAIEVFEALDHVGVLARLLPEWAHVRSLPQRNAYHHHTVDRHLLETVAQCATLLEAGSLRGPDVPIDAIVARACRRPELLLLAALLHDIGKGLPEDHAVAGARIARNVAHRLALDSEGAEILDWLVRDHLLMADTATRRDLSDVATIERFCVPLAGDGERLRLLYLLTIGDSIATGPAAWNRSKAALLADLFYKAAAIVESDSSDRVVEARRAALADRIGADAADALFDAMPPGYLLAFDVDVMATHSVLVRDGVLAVGYDASDDGKVVVTVAAPDRTGLLATVAGALTCCGLAVEAATLFTSKTGMALDVFTTTDTYGRYADGAARIKSTIERAIAGDLDVAVGVAERRKHYQRGVVNPTIEMIVDADASETSTVIEVHATDQVGLLYELACAFADCELDVSVAKVLTLADRVIDVFYVQDRGSKIDDPVVLDKLARRIALLASGDPSHR